MVLRFDNRKLEYIFVIGDMTFNKVFELILNVLFELISNVLFDINFNPVPARKVIIVLLLTSIVVVLFIELEPPVADSILLAEDNVNKPAFVDVKVVSAAPSTVFALKNLIYEFVLSEFTVIPFLLLFSARMLLTEVFNEVARKTSVFVLSPDII